MRTVGAHRWAGSSGLPLLRNHVRDIDHGKLTLDRKTEGFFCSLFSRSRIHRGQYTYSGVADYASIKKKENPPKIHYRTRKQCLMYAAPNVSRSQCREWFCLCLPPSPSLPIDETRNSQIKQTNKSNYVERVRSTSSSDSV